MKNMTPSAQTMTDGQIDKAVDVYRSILRKHRDELGSETVQQVLGQPEFATEMVAVLRKRVEAVSNMIVRRVKVNLSRSPQQALDATGRKQYVDSNVVAAMPRGEGENAEVFFFKEGRYLNDEELDEKFELRDLRPADPYTLAAVNEADPTFADDHPNATHWRDENGNWCYATFGRWNGEHGVYVYRYSDDWTGSWWFAGLRK